MRDLVVSTMTPATTGVAGPVRPDGTTITVSSGVISAVGGSTGGVKAYFPDNGAYGTITDGGSFGSGSHPASSNGYSSLATLQAAYPGCTFNATGSGTNLTVNSITSGALWPGQVLLATTGVSAGTTIVAQTNSYGGPAGGIGVYTTSASTTVSAGTVQSSYATALSNQMSGLMIQKAIMAANTAADGHVYLKPGYYFNLPIGIAFPAYCNGMLIGQNMPTLLCSVCGSNPGVTFLGATAVVPMTGVLLAGLDTKAFGTETGLGTANTGIFTSGTVGAKFYGCSFCTMTNIVWQNFDVATYFDAPVGGNHMLCFRDCSYVLNNKAITIDNPSAFDSFERMSWDNCTAGSNNYGVYLNFAGSAGGAIGTGGGIAADAYLLNCSIDYSSVYQIWYNGSAAAGDLISSVYAIGCHIETSNERTGTNPRVLNDGNIAFIACELFDNSNSGVLPYWATNYSSQAAINFVACKPPGYPNGNNSVALVGGTNTNNVQSQGIVSRGSGWQAWILPGVEGHHTADPVQLAISTNTTLYNWYPTNTIIPITATCTVTVPTDATVFRAFWGSFLFTVLPGVTLTIAGSVTFTGASLTIAGGTSGKNVVLTKKGTADNWNVTY
jgi:hypothetical protein